MLRHGSGPGVGWPSSTYGAGAFNLVNAGRGRLCRAFPGGGDFRRARRRNEQMSGFLLHHQARAAPETQARMFREITCDQAILNDAATRAGARSRACCASAWSTRLPVYLELPRDMTACRGRRCAGAAAPLRRSRGRWRECAEEVLERLSGAKSPVILVDVDVRRFGSEERSPAAPPSSASRW
ncbi:MAG: hypothetical protein QM753_11655 [Thermomicrobiales bacterium]